MGGPVCTSWVVRGPGVLPFYLEPLPVIPVLNTPQRTSHPVSSPYGLPSRVTYLSLPQERLFVTLWDHVWPKPSQNPPVSSGSETRDKWGLDLPHGQGHSGGRDGNVTQTLSGLPKSERRRVWFLFSVKYLTSSLSYNKRLPLRGCLYYVILVGACWGFRVSWNCAPMFRAMTESTCTFLVFLSFAPLSLFRD